MQHRTASLILAVWSLALLLAACDGVRPTTTSRAQVEPGDAGTAGRDAPQPRDRGDAGESISPDCGDGVRGQNEACDDGNRQDTDGCARDCGLVERGFSCPREGEPCHRIARCGDGVRVLPELCDDGNPERDDGCSDTCKIEIGFKCEGAPSVCSPSVCGDGREEGAESCDDGNAQPFDGCSATCQREPDCSRGACRSECGDGLVIPPEECDDGNELAGDGCSEECTKERGFECSDDASCERIGDQCVLRVAAVYRDFSEDHPDFGVSCDGLKLGVVKPMLNAQGRPELVDQAKADGNCIGSAESFAEWYADGPRAKTRVSSVVLFDNEKGGYVNRLTEKGDRFIGPGAQPIHDKPCATPGMGCVPCQYAPQQSCAVVRSDGNPLFFPLNDFDDAWPDGRYPAKVPEQYGATGWPWATSWGYWPANFTPSAENNFSFTSEVKYWYLFDPSVPSTLDFTGDDDVWVFVNGKLAVDLGGVHVPQSGSVQIDAASGMDTYGMQPGKVYPIAIFHAERKREGSSFKLTLSGFNTRRSDCRAVCGDGIVGLGEECDDAENDGGYGECAKGCKLGAYCGDGIIQAGEDCDDGPSTKNGCGPDTACRRIVVI